MNKELEQFLLGMGAMGEALAVFRDVLLKNGFTREETLDLTRTFLRETIFNATQNKEEN